MSSLSKFPTFIDAKIDFFFTLINKYSEKVELFDLSLPEKWKWRMLIEMDTLWCRVLEARYIEILNRQKVYLNKRLNVLSYLWWKDLYSIESYNSAIVDWFKTDLRKNKLIMVRTRGGRAYKLVGAIAPRAYLIIFPLPPPPPNG